MKSSVFTRLLALLLAAMLAFGIFTSCGTENAKDPEINITNGESVEIELNGTLMLEVVDENNLIEQSIFTSSEPLGVLALGVWNSFWFLWGILAA